MRSLAKRVALLAVVTFSWPAWAQLAVPPAPWKGAGPTPCVGSDGGVHQCPPTLRVTAVRAGRLFDSKQSGGTGAYEWVFKGYSPATRCCQGK